ncbi:MAG: PEP-CTERM/exosortase system-associated acyltransferase [Nitrosomonas sp.]|nr:PEP-CTERM/exosortase system-associated acyltransferase [Nitrosomonas sp.]
MSPQDMNLGASFKEYFEIIPASSKELKNEAYRIRHQVYCEDLNFEPLRSNGFETDEYDSSALHLLIRSIKFDMFIGCTRIIRPKAINLHAPLPFEKICTNSLNRSIVDPTQLPRNKIAEVSRLAVIASFRRRKDEAKKPINISDEDFGKPQDPHSRFPYIPLGLFIGTIELARLNNIDYLFMLTEERLANHFGKLGAHNQIIGAPIEHRGTRIPSMVYIEEIVRNMRPIFRPLYQVISTDISKNVVCTAHLKNLPCKMSETLMDAGVLT